MHKNFLLCIEKIFLKLAIKLIKIVIKVLKIKKYFMYIYICNWRKRVKERKKTFFQSNYFILPDFAHFVPSWNLTLRLSLHIMVFNWGKAQLFLNGLIRKVDPQGYGGPPFLGVVETWYYSLQKMLPGFLIKLKLTLPLLFVQSDCVLFCLPCLFLLGNLHACTMKGRKRPYLICTLL